MQIIKKLILSLDGTKREFLTLKYLNLFLFILLALSIWAASHNFSYAPPISDERWSYNGVVFEKITRELPNGKIGTIIRLRSISEDGVVNFRFNAPRGMLNWSMFVRGDSYAKVGLWFWADQLVLSAMRVDADWKRVTVVQSNADEKELVVQIGGEKTFTFGETIEIWGTAVERGTTTQRSSRVSIVSWYLGKILLPVQGGGIWLLIVVLGGYLILQYLPAFRKKYPFVFKATVKFISCSLLILFLSWFGLELISASALFAFKPNTNFVGTALEFFQTSKLNWSQLHAVKPGLFSPITQVTRRDGDASGPYDINSLGLVDNESANPILHVMPEKPENTMRVVLHGGSTAMGIGATDGTRTISGQLERLLNENSKDGKIFQVLNYGHGSGESFSDLMFMVAGSAHLEPDATISLFGYNDAFAATETGYFNVGDRPFLGNWAAFSYSLFESANGLVRQDVKVRLLPFTSKLVNHILDDVNRQRIKKMSYQSLPILKVTQLVDSKKSRDHWLLTNLRYAAGYFTTRASKVYIGYLQPHPLQFKKLVAAEKNQVVASIEKLTSVPFEDYDERMRGMFDLYGDGVGALNDEYKDFENIHFHDLRWIFMDASDASYIDVIHYTESAQMKIAERIYRDLSRQTSFAPHLNN